jgi:hypothetical protein
MGRPRIVDWPADSLMREMIATMTYAEIQRHIGCSRNALYLHLSRNGLIRVSPHGQHKRRASTVRHVRVADEFDGCYRAREPWSPVKGPLSYWQQAGIQMLEDVA